jgi:predicted MPP superfamily phosphohydrolase
MTIDWWNLKTTMPNRLFVIGDIHGCATGLKTLNEAIDPQPEDTVVLLGDVIDWGPDSRDCVRQVIELSNRCRLVLVRGNHEEMLFAALESQSELRYWLKFGGEETVKSYGYRGRESSSTTTTSDSSRPTPATTTRRASSSSSTPRTTRTNR